MATKRIISIDVETHDESFKAFSALFDHHSDKVDELPASWKKLDEAMSTTGQGFARASLNTKDALAIAATQTTMIVEALRRATIGQKDLGAATTSSAKSMKALAESARTVGDSVFGIAKFMTRIGSIGGIGAALAGIGSGLGIFSLANSAVNQQRAAGGLGLTPGQMNAFNVNLSPFIGGGVLPGAANAQADLTQQGYLAALGINPAQAQRENAAQLAIQEINAVRAAWQRTHNLNSAQAQAALALGFTPSDIRNVGTMNGRELATYERSALGDAGALGFSPKVAADWAAFDVQLHKAGITIESSLIEGLSPLAPQLARLSGEVSSFLASFIKNDAPGLIKTLSNGLQWLGNYLGSPQFQKDLTSFEAGVSAIGADIVNALKFFKLIPGNPSSAGSPTTGTYPVSPGHVAYDPTNMTDNWPPIVRKALGLPPVEFPFPDDADKQVRNKNLGLITIATDPLKAYDFSGIESKDKLPPGYLKALAMVESSGRPGAISPAGALGMFQLMPGTANAYGADPMDVGQSAFTAGLITRQNLDKYGGDLRKAIAAYNWGSGSSKDPRLDADIAKWGKDWEKHIPAETEGEINKVMALMSATPPGSTTNSPTPTATAMHSGPELHMAVKALTKAVNDLAARSAKVPHVTISNPTSARVHVAANASSF